MKKSICLLILSLFFVFGCKESPNSTTSNRIPGSDLPTASGDGPDAVFDIPTPSVTGGSVSGNSTDGFCVHLTWQSNAPGYAEGYSSYAQDPTSPTDLNGGHGWEYWGNTQLTIVQTTPSGNPNYSGHYEVYRDGEKLADITGNSYDDCDLEPGTYTYTIKAKSRERASGDGNERDDENTHHSLMSEGFEVEVGCEEVEIDPIFEINPILGSGGGNGVWNTAATMWTANSSATNQNMNMFYNVRQINRTQNSCTGVITEVSEEAWTGNSYLRRSGGYWRKSLPWEDSDAFHHNGNETGGNGSGLGKFPTGCHTIQWTIDTTEGVMGTFILNMNSTCTP